MTDPVVRFLLQAHRFLLIAGTAVLAIGTSRLADGANDVGSWLLTLGSAALMYFADVSGVMDRASEELAQSTSRTASQTRPDVFASRAPRGMLIWVAMSVVAIAVGLAWGQIDCLFRS